MKAVVVEALNKICVKDVERPVVAANQVLIRVKACGICKTDVSICSGQFYSKLPLVPGHELAGDIVEMGKDVKGFSIGDKVVADVTVLCGYCYYCRKNQPLYCENMVTIGVNRAGGFAEYVVAQYDKCFKFEGISYEEASFSEPVGCAIHAVDIIDIKLGDDVLLFGAGPTGIILAQLLKKAGAGRVVVAAPTESKLKLLNELGINQTFKIDKKDYSKHEKEIRHKFPVGFDVIVDATGYAPMIESAPRYAKKGARIVIYGVCPADATITLSPYEIFIKELKVMGSFAETHCFDRAVKCLEDGSVKVKHMITASFDLEGFEQALEIVTRGGENMKVMINP